MSQASVDPTIPDGLIEPLLKARRIVVFTGAGMSAESGIATFRGSTDSVWSSMSPADLATPNAWRKDKELVWAWYEARRHDVNQAQPNAGHTSIAQLAEALQGVHGEAVQVDVITQNVDNLHERGGCQQVVHLHGSLFAPRCSACNRPGEFALADPDGTQTRVKPPQCGHCGGPIRPGVVWFGENLPEDSWNQAVDLICQCDVMIVIGTSGVVRPAADLPGLANKLDKFTVEINPERTGLTDSMNLFWQQSAAQGLPFVLGALKAD